ncbi:MAG: RND transporter, partial [Candidatus Rokuibacteriota bacterium]
LSRTLVPTMVLYLLAPEARARERREAGHDAPERPSLFGRLSDAFEAGFHTLTTTYEGALDVALAHTRTVIVVFLAFAAVSLFLYPFVGRDFFPTVDAGQLRLHARAPAGTRIEETERYFQQVEDYIRQVIPAGELAAII